MRRVASMILCHDKPKNRAKQIARFVETAYALRELKNFSTLHAFVAGINAAASDGDATMDFFRRGHHALYKLLVSYDVLFQQHRSHQAYRNAFRHADGACIPALYAPSTHGVLSDMLTAAARAARCTSPTSSARTTGTRTRRTTTRRSCTGPSSRCSAGSSRASSRAGPRARARATTASPSAAACASSSAPRRCSRPRYRCAALVRVPRKLTRLDRVQMQFVRAELGAAEGDATPRTLLSRTYSPESTGPRVRDSAFFRKLFK
jgi:hypothetical protein